MKDNKSERHVKQDGHKLRLIKGGGLRTINTDVDLFNLLFDQLDRTEPQIAVDDDLRGAVDELRQAMAEDGYVDSPPVDVGELLGGIWWDAVPADAATCGSRLLMLIGCLSESMTVVGADVKVPCARVIVMMMVVDWGYIDSLQYSEDGWTIRSTPEYEANYGVRVEWTQPKRIVSDDAFNLRDIFYEKWEPDLRKILCKSRKRRKRKAK